MKLLLLLCAQVSTHFALDNNGNDKSTNLTYFLASITGAQVPGAINGRVHENKFEAKSSYSENLEHISRTRRSAVSLRRN